MKADELQYNTIYTIKGIDYEYNGVRFHHNTNKIRSYEFFNINETLNVPALKLNEVKLK